MLLLGVRPNISEESDIFSISSSVLSHMNQSKDFSDVSEELAQFITFVKMNLGELGQLMVAFDNETQIFSADSVNLKEEILDCLVIINNMTNKVDFLQLNPISTYSGSQDRKWE
jgi:ATP binding cassette subfamily A (ABC1) protein 13